MKKPLRILSGVLLVSIILAAGCTTPPATAPMSPPPAPAPTGQSPVKAYDAAQQARLAWFEQARLGMFIHWGLYAVPAGQWPGRTNKNRAEWIMIQENI